MATFGTFAGALSSTDLNARHGGSWRRVANQSIPNNTLTSISWDTEDADTDAFAVPTFTTLTVPVGLGGIYAITAIVAYGTSGLGANSIRFNISGTIFYDSYGPNGASGQQCSSATLPLAAGATLIVQTTHNVGSSQNVTGSLYVTRLGA